MGRTFSKSQRKPLPDVAERFGLAADTGRGRVVPFTADACYASLTDGGWRYWIRYDGASTSFGDSVGRLVPIERALFMERLNDHATGPIRPSFWKRAAGEAVVFDLVDDDVVERFSLACSVGEALSRSERLSFVRPDRPGQCTAQVICDALPNLNVNVSLWAVDAPSVALVLFPNVILLRRDGHQWVVPYAEVAVRLDRKGDGHVSSEICLALSDQRVRLLVSDPECARQAVEGVETLIAFERRKKTHVGPKASGASERKRRVSETSCGRIVVKPKPESSTEPAPSDRIVVTVKLGKDVSRPGPQPDLGLETPRAEIGDESLIFCEDSGLVFATESPVVEDVIPLEPPAPHKGKLRAAVGALLAHVAKASDGFAPAEQRVIREILQLPAGFDLARKYSAVLPGSKPLAFAANVVRQQPPGVRGRVLSECERVANADGEASPAEREALAMLCKALGD
jgi:uncharacterized tellurite resistance protein B-like protein